MHVIIDRLFLPCVASSACLCCVRVSQRQGVVISRCPMAQTNLIVPARPPTHSKNNNTNITR